MNTKQLKDKILAMAMGGELVEQDPTDESAEILLEKIKEEKAKLIVEKKIKKEKTLAPIEKDDVPYQLPQGWVWTRLGELASHISKGTTPRGGNSAYTTEGIKFLRVENIKENFIFDFSDVKYIDVETNNTALKRSILEENDILITIAGTLGRATVVPKEILPINTNQAVSFTRLVNNELVNARYIAYFIKSNTFVNSITKNTKTTSIPNLTLEMISRTLIPLPPLEEQKRIVEKIETLFAEVDKLEESRENLDVLKGKLDKKLLDMAMRGELVEQDPTDESAEILLEKIKEEKAKLIAEKKIKKEKPLAPVEEDEIPYDLPQGWVWTRLGDVANIYTGNSINAKLKEEKYTNISEGYNYIATKDISFTEKIDYDNGVKIPFEEEKYKIAHKGSTLLCIEGGSAGRKVGILDEDVCFVNKLASINSYLIDNHYMYTYVLSPVFKKEFYSNIQGLIGGVSVNTLKNIKIPVPPLVEQKRIVNKLKEVREIIKETL